MDTRLEGEAPAEPLWREGVVPGWRLSRSFALPIRCLLTPCSTYSRHNQRIASGSTAAPWMSLCPPVP